MLLLFSCRVADCPPFWEKSCSFGLLCASFVNILSIGVCASFSFGFEGGMWDSIVLFFIIAFLFTLYWIWSIIPNDFYETFL